MTVYFILQIIRVECGSLCLLKPVPSVLRVSSLKRITDFKWEDLITELRTRAPTLLAILQAAAQPMGSKKSSLPASIVGMAAGILLKSRNQNMCALQSVVSTLLYAGHASKKVCTFTCFCYFDFVVINVLSCSGSK